MNSEQKFVGVTKEVVEEFLGSLETADLEADVVKRLQDTILGQGKISEKAIRNALFPET